MSESRRKQADRRLIEVLLAEELADQKAAEGTATGRPAGRLLALPPPRERRGSKVAAAAILFGVGVVALMMSSDFDAPARGEAHRLQDPAPVEVVIADDAAAYLKLLATATRIQLTRKETVGAGRVRGARNQSADRLDSIRWPEVLRIDGERFERWRTALRRCAPNAEPSSNLGTTYELELALPGNRVVRSFTSIDGEESRIWIAAGHAVKPDEQLRRMLTRAHEETLELHRKATGKVEDAEQLLELDRGSRLLDVPVELLADVDIAERLPEVGQLTLRGQPDGATWSMVARLRKLERLQVAGAELDADAIGRIAKLGGLRALSLRQCGAIEADALRQLGQLRRLHTLHLIDSHPGADELDLLPLAALPVLREFGLRSRHMLTTEQLEVIGHTKIERLLLVDLDMQGDLSELANLPSLEDVVLVAEVGDQELQPLSQIESLRRLTVRNSTADGSFVDAVTSEVPECEIDWTLDARWWQTDYAFRYIERAWPVVR